MNNAVFSRIYEYLDVLKNEGFEDEASKIKNAIDSKSNESELLSEIKNIINHFRFQQIPNKLKLVSNEIIHGINTFLQPKHVHLPLDNLTLKKEKKLFSILLLFSLFVWVGLIGTLVMIPLVLTSMFLLWIGNGLLVAYLRSDTIEVSQNQMPELYSILLEACSSLGITTPPCIYILQSGGVLNAFATRHASRDFVVLYSDILETLGHNSNEIKFVLGHELGHIKRKHIFKSLLILPGLALPLVAPAYHRACESSCDRYGAFVSGDLYASIRAMLAISGGRSLYKELHAQPFAQQHHNNRGFFVSLHELISGYPTSSKRVADLVAISENRTSKKPSRNPFAYLFASFYFSPQLVIFAVIVGVMASSLIPIFNEIRVQARERYAQQVNDEEHRIHQNSAYTDNDYSFMN